MVRIQKVPDIAWLAVYVVIGWLVLTQLLSGAEPLPAQQSRREEPPRGVTLTISVIDGTTVYCAARVDMAASDTLFVDTSDAPELLRSLNCLDPGDP